MIQIGNYAIALALTFCVYATFAVFYGARSGRRELVHHHALDDERRQEIVEQLRGELAKVEGVQAVLGPEKFAEIGQPTPEQDPHGADLWLAAESGYSFTDSQDGDAIVVPRGSRGGTHGYLPDQPDMLGTLVISGDGVAPGKRLGKVSNTDVAPTVTKLLGVELPTADGRVLDVE